MRNFLFSNNHHSICFILGSVFCFFASNGALSSEIVLSNATVFNAQTAQPMKGVSIHILDGKIIKLQQSVGESYSDGTVRDVIDLKGKAVTAGLIDSWTHLGLTSASGDWRPSVKTAYLLRTNDDYIALNRQEGITTALVAPMSNGGGYIASGQASIINLTQEAFLVTSKAGLFSYAENPSEPFLKSLSSLHQLRNIHQVGEAFYEKGFALKENGVSREDLLNYLDLKTVYEHMERGKRWVIYADSLENIYQAVRLKKKYGVNVVIAGGKDAWMIASAIAKQNIPLIINPMLYDAEALQVIDKANITVAFASFDRTKVSVLRALAVAAYAKGWSHTKSLSAITSNPAKIWGQDNIGRLSVGGKADLLVWNGDPLQLTSWTEKIMVGGVWQNMLSKRDTLGIRYKTLQRSTPFPYR